MTKKIDFEFHFEVEYVPISTPEQEYRYWRAMEFILELIRREINKENDVRTQTIDERFRFRNQR